MEAYQFISILDNVAGPVFYTISHRTQVTHEVWIPDDISGYQMTFPGEMLGIVVKLKNWSQQDYKKLFLK